MNGGETVTFESARWTLFASGAIAAALALTSVPVGAQATSMPSSRPRADTTHPPEWVIEQQTRDRWMHGRQRARFSPFASSQRAVLIDSLRQSAAGRRLYLTLGRTASGRDSALIAVGPDGRIVKLEVGLAPFKRLGPPMPGDSARFVEHRRHPIDGSVALAETRVWDLVPTFPDSAIHAGRTWTDTISRVANDGPFRQSLSGTRTSWIVDDTVVDGRRLWIVRDSASVRHEEHYVERERTLDTLVEVSRSATGTLRGAYLYDPALTLYRWREDTTRLSGSAVLRYPDARAFTTPARYERVRRWDLFDGSAYAVRLTQRRSAALNAQGGMVRVASSELEKRLASGEVAIRDSLLLAWRHTLDPDEAAQLFRSLQLWARNTRTSAMLDSVRIAEGDSAYLYQWLADRAYSTERPIDTAAVRAMLPFMEDPSIAWGFNVSRDWPYENLVQALTTWPSAAADPRSRTSSCAIEACRMLGAQWRTARESRLRDVGLVALMSLDPRRWADTVLALDGPRHPLLHPAAMLARGVGATWEAASKAPVPPPNSDWRRWLEWMNGIDPRYLPLENEVAASMRQPVRTTPEVRFEESHRTAIRFYMARTGRDVIAELHRGYERATSDSARLVFGTMLRDLDELQMTESEIANAFSSGVPVRIELARQALIAALQDSGKAMTPANAAPLVDRLLAATVDTAPLWRVGAADLPASLRRPRPEVHATIGRVLLNAATLPEAIRAKWAGRVAIITSAEWNRRDPRTGGVFYSVAPVRSWGRFARVELTLSERSTRSEGQAPRQYAAGTTYYLMKLNDEWVIVGQDGWVT